jgi:glycosyltransferase involved in cell wall biosynthesis
MGIVDHVLTTAAPVRGASADRDASGEASSDQSGDSSDPLIRVALVAPPYFDVPPRGYGGIEAVVADLANSLVDQGHRVTLLGAGRPGTRATFWPVWETTIPDRLGEAFPEVAHAAVVRRAVAELFVEGAVDVVHDHTVAGPLNAPAYRDLGLPTVVTAHGPVEADLRTIYGALGADIALVAISERQRQLAPELNWVATVHNALSLGAWPFRAEKGEYALFLGRFHQDKGPHLALDAAHAAGVPLILAGKCTEPCEREFFAKEVEPRLGPHDEVFGVADANAKRRLLSKARCLLFPIQWEEPFGMVMIEAMACGTPVVALRAGSVPEVVVHGTTGLICDDVAELPAAIDEAGSIDPVACRTHVAQNFTSERLARGYTRAYRAAMASLRTTGGATPPVLADLRAA